MALKGTHIDSNTGLTVTDVYARVDSLVLDNIGVVDGVNTGKARVRISIFADQASRDSDKEPIAKEERIYPIDDFLSAIDQAYLKTKAESEYAEFADV